MISMKKSWLLAFGAVALTSGCSYYHYQFDLDDVQDGGAASAASGGATHIVSRSLQTGAVFEDATLRMKLQVEPSAMRFVIENKTASPLTLLWDRMAIQGLDGRSYHVMPGDKTLGEMSAGAAQPSSTIFPKATYENTFLNWDGVPRSWLVANDEGFARAMVDKTLVVRVPIEHDGMLTNYMLQLHVTSYTR